MTGIGRVESLEEREGEGGRGEGMGEGRELARKELLVARVGCHRLDRLYGEMCWTAPR